LAQARSAFERCVPMSRSAGGAYRSGAGVGEACPDSEAPHKHVGLPGSLFEMEGANPPLRKSATFVVGHTVGAQHGDRTEAERIEAYEFFGVGFALAKALAQHDRDVAVRVFILDNSGSTCECDGHVLQRIGDNGYYKSEPSSRWEEIRSMALDQARWNDRVGVRSEFYLVNPPCPEELVEGRDFAVIDPAKGHGDAQVAALAQILERNGPRGPTPLVPRLKQLRASLRKRIPSGYRVMLSIVTDGLPTSGNYTKQDKDSQIHEQEKFIQELRDFANSFNSSLVIRLATDEDDVVEFYNKIDQEVELPLDILDDIQGEAKEIHAAGNGWLTYTPMIHRIREGGTMLKLFDMLDERPFKPVEIAALLELLLQRRGDPPFPRDPKELLEVVAAAVERSPLVYDGRLHKMAKPVDLKLLKKALGKKQGVAQACSLM